MEIEFKVNPKIKTHKIIIVIIALSIILCIASLPLGKLSFYNHSQKLLESGNYTEAYKNFQQLGNYKESKQMQNECIYAQAIDFACNGKYIDSYEKFLSIKNYKDSQERMKSIYNQYKDDQISKIKSSNISDTITFGTYKGKPIEWTVLAKDEKKQNILIISKYCLTEKEFQTSDYATWDNSTIRKWLNNDFYNKSFTKTEKSMILNSKLKNKKNEKYDQSSGKDTNDKIFLLSVDEAKKYYYANKERISENLDSKNVDWFLRTQGNSDFRNSYISYYDGSIDYDGFEQYEAHGIKPAIWINIK